MRFHLSFTWNVLFPPSTQVQNLLLLFFKPSTKSLRTGPDRWRPAGGEPKLKAAGETNTWSSWMANELQ